MLKVGVLLESRLDAGGNRYELTMARLLHARRGKSYDFIFFVPDEISRGTLQSLGLGQVVVLQDSYLQKVHRLLLRSPLAYRALRGLRLHRNAMEALLARYGVELCYFLSPSYRCRDLSAHSFIVTLWDLSHRDCPEFPEATWGKEFEVREQLYTTFLKKAVAVSVDSDLGKANVVRRYGVDEERVHVLPFLPPNVLGDQQSSIDVRTKHQLEGEYIFYPAQFWAHKNHIYILDALKLLRDRDGITVSAVFTGMDKGNLAYILSKAEEYGLQRQVRHLGFVSAEDIPALYEHAIALVMPTYFGPTNLPPLEAFSVGCPVCYPAHRWMDDSIADAVFSINLDDPASLADQLLTIRSQPGVVDRKLECGRRHLRGWTEDDLWARLEPILAEFAVRRRTWGRSWPESAGA